MLCDGLQDRVTCTFMSVTIAAGHAVTTDDRGRLNVPKKELVSVLQVLLQCDCPGSCHMLLSAAAAARPRQRP
jgi:hypothetical protein